MQEVRRVERRTCPRFAVFRGCSIIALNAITEVTMLNVSRNGIATLGPQLEVAPGDRVTFCIEGLSIMLDAVVINVSYGRIGARFDLPAETGAMWEAEFDAMVAGLDPL